MICFLIPTYNEEANIPVLAGNLLNVLPEREKFFVFVDDCSTDGTIDIIEKSFPKDKLQIIRKEANGGPGDSFNIGFEWILSNKDKATEGVVTVEADNTSDLKILPDMITISGLGYELVLASVYAQGGGFDKTSFFRKLISFFANMIFRSIFNIKVMTLSSFYRVYKIELLERIKKYYPVLIRERGFICMLEILLKSIRANASIIEVPMVLRSEMRKGRSKMKILKTSLSYMRFMLSSKR